MSNRNFDSRVITQRLQNQVYARNLYQNNINGQTLINNPQNSDGNASRFNTFVPGAQTEYFRGLVGAGETISVGGIVNIPPFSSMHMVPTTPATVPGAPTIIGGIVGSQQVTLNFTAPLSDGDSPIIYYEYSINDEPFISTGSTSLSITITGLVNGDNYVIVIRAVNSVGPGPISNEAEADPTNVVVNNLKSDYLPDNGTLSKWIDSQGDINAIMSGSPLYSSATGYTFNGTSQYGRINSSNNINNFTNTNNYTVEIWFNASSGQPSVTLATILEKWNSTNQFRYPYAFRYAENTSILQCAAFDGVNNPVTEISGINTGIWYQVAATFDFTSINKILTVYRNGVSVNNLSLSGVNNVSNTSQVAIGHRINASTLNPQFMFKGSIGLIRFYNTALSSAEVLQNFNANRYIFNI